MSTLVIARFTLREATRKKAVLGGILLTVIFLLLYTLGTYFAFRDLSQQVRLTPAMRRSIDGELLLAGLYFVNFIGGLLAIFSSVGTISGEIEQGTLHAVVPKPLRRWEIVLGKWLGFAAMLTIYVVVTSLVALLIVYVQSGYLPLQPATGLAVMVLNALLLLSLSMLGTCSISTVATGILAFMLYALALAGGRLEQLGTIINNQTLESIGIATSLVIPSDALWRMAASTMGSAGFFGAGGGGPQPGMFTVTAAPSTWMLAYAIIYSLAALVAATVVFQKRDL